jgi:hypothetical protein
MRRDIEKAATRSHNFSRREGITDCQLAKNRDITQNPKPADSSPLSFLPVYKTVRSARLRTDG